MIRKGARSCRALISHSLACFLPLAITTSPATACRMGLLLLKNRIPSCLPEITQFLRGWSLCPPGRLCQPASSGRGTRWNHRGRPRTPEQPWRGNNHPGPEGGRGGRQWESARGLPWVGCYFRLWPACPVGLVWPGLTMTFGVGHR